jgi:hypothetical protein
MATHVGLDTAWDDSFVAFAPTTRKVVPISSLVEALEIEIGELPDLKESSLLTIFAANVA